MPVGSEVAQKVKEAEFQGKMWGSGETQAQWWEI